MTISDTLSLSLSFFDFSQARLSEAEKAYDELSDKERMIMGKYFFTLNSSFD
jgi:hypothetical protein